MEDDYGTDHNELVVKVVPAVVEEVHPIDDIVSAWVNGHLANSVFSQDTPAWNHLQTVLPALSLALKGVPHDAV